MKNTTSNNTTASTIIFASVMGVLAVTAIVFLLISMFGNWASNLPLTIALGCVGLAGILNVVHLVKNGKRSAD
ncbi:MAG: hypothetical protein IKG01_09795 [Lachnospiraceae bacterium]|nr:hypothetical protein [Lachnospiraceae bacterium]